MPDVNVRNVPEAVLERLRGQAEAEGVSLSEWIRIALADRAELPTAAELATRRSGLVKSAQPSDEFAAFYRRRLHRRTG
jgi:plasmid stability protein